MGAAPVTGLAIYERLRALWPGYSEADVAAELGTNERWLRRLRDGPGEYQRKLLEVLDVIGWLNPNGDVSPDEQRRRAALLGASRRAAKEQEAPQSREG